MFSSECACVPLLTSQVLLTGESIESLWAPESRTLFSISQTGVWPSSLTFENSLSIVPTRPRTMIPPETMPIECTFPSTSEEDGRRLFPSTLEFMVHPHDIVTEWGGFQWPLVVRSPARLRKPRSPSAYTSHLYVRLHVSIVTEDGQSLWDGDKVCTGCRDLWVSMRSGSVERAWAIINLHATEPPLKHNTRYRVAVTPYVETMTRWGNRALSLPFTYMPVRHRRWPFACLGVANGKYIRKPSNQEISSVEWAFEDLPELYLRLPIAVKDENGADKWKPSPALNFCIPPQSKYTTAKGLAVPVVVRASHLESRFGKWGPTMDETQKPMMGISLIVPPELMRDGKGRKGAGNIPVVRCGRETHEMELSGSYVDVKAFAQHKCRGRQPVRYGVFGANIPFPDNVEEGSGYKFRVKLFFTRLVESNVVSIIESRAFDIVREGALENDQIPGNYRKLLLLTLTPLCANQTDKSLLGGDEERCLLRMLREDKTFDVQYSGTVDPVPNEKELRKKILQYST
ncbi:hypothetical protein F4780DRAFT_763245 [Xylariomycetidae sp. FL0641]|nr:hypothetical protein F4780DRAFT_763245 [Xylariomycetidae sp. FL0641]